MQSAPIGYLTVAVAGLAFWEMAHLVLGTKEPWDSPNYLGFYLGALGLSAVFGYLFHKRAWRWGVIVIFAQLPVMAVHSRLGPLVAIGVVLLTFLAMPAALAAIGASQLRELQRRD